jgi:hypothetical protein
MQFLSYCWWPINSYQKQEAALPPVHHQRMRLADRLKLEFIWLRIGFWNHPRLPTYTHGQRELTEGTVLDLECNGAAVTRCEAT